MSIIQPEREIIDRTTQSIRYLEHGWPTELCRWHSHEEYELHLVVATRGKAFIGDYIGDFKPGGLFLTGPNLPHNWITDDVWPEPLEVRDMLVQFSQDSIDRLTEAFPEFADIRQMLLLAQSGIEFIDFPPATARRHLAAIRDGKGTARILSLLDFLHDLYEHGNMTTLSVARIVQPKGGSRYARIGEVVDFIVKNFAEELTVEKAANMAAMSPATFSRNFQIVTGHRFVEFVNRVRIGQACGMLYATDDHITSICYTVGFQNLANFNRHFLKMKDMTPSAYRETARSELAPQTERMQ